MDSYRFSNVDSYDTPENAAESRFFRLTGRSRFYFYFDNFRTYIRSGIAARHGKLDADCQIRNSNRNLDLVERCGGHIHLRGLNFLREVAGEPIVVIANHMSMLETSTVHAIIREYLDFSFLVKASLLRTPFMKDILTAFKAVPMTRTNPRADLKAILTLGKDVIDAKRSMIVFPQATRSREFQPEHFSSIGVKLAKHAGARVLPLALKTDFIGNGKGIFKDFGPIHPERHVWFEFGAPMAITGNGQHEQEKIIEFISEHLDCWNRLEKEAQK